MHVSVTLLFNVHNNVSKFDRVTNCIAKREKEPSRVPVKIFNMKDWKKRKNHKKLKASVKSRFSIIRE